MTSTLYTDKKTFGQEIFYYFFIFAFTTIDFIIFVYIIKVV